MSGPNSNGPPGAYFPGLPFLVNSSLAGNVTWGDFAQATVTAGPVTFPGQRLRGTSLGHAMPTYFPLSRSFVPTLTQDTTMMPLLAAQITQTSNAAVLQALKATLANANADAWNAAGIGVPGVGTGDRGMFASLPVQAAQPVSTGQDVPSAARNPPTTSQHQLNTSQLLPVPIAFSAQAPQGGLLCHGISFQSNLGGGGNFGFASCMPHLPGGMNMSGACGPNTLYGGRAAVDDSTPLPPVQAVVPRRRGKERLVVLTLDFLAPYFDQPLDAVSKKLGVSRSTLKAVAPPPCISAHSA